MPPRKTTAALAFISSNNLNLTVTTSGTKAAPRTKINKWVLNWGDGSTTSGVSQPDVIQSHVYINSGTYSLTLNVYDSRGGSAIAYLTVVITEIIIPPPIPPPGMILTPSNAVRATSNGQVIEQLDINDSFGIVVDGFSDVILRNIKIRHSNGYGINFNNAPRLKIENIDISYIGGPAKGVNPSDQLNNINGQFSDDIVINRVRLNKGSSGIYLDRCQRPACTFLSGSDFRGPFPRGQLIQLNSCDNGLIEDFSSLSIPGQSWDEDNVNIFGCSNPTIRRGLLDGNNSPSGIGVIFEQPLPKSGGLVEDVDTIRQGNGCFSAYTEGHDITFRRCNAKDNICSDQGRGLPASGGLMYAVGPSSTGIRLEECKYFNPCNGTVWDTGSISYLDLTNVDFVLRNPIILVFPWE